MKETLSSFKSQLDQLIEKQFFAALKKEIDHDLNELEEIEKQCVAILSDSCQNLEELAKRKSRVLSIIEQSWANSQGQRISDYDPEFIKQLDDLISTLPKKRTLEQPAQRFKITAEDQGILKLIKRLKIGFFHLSKSPQKLFNRFRKQPKKISHWKHVVPFRELAEFYIKGLWIEAISDIRAKHYRPLLEAYLEIKEWEMGHMTEKKPSPAPHAFETLKKQRTKLRKEVKAELLGQANAAFDKFQQAILCVNTIESRKLDFKAKKIEKTLQTASEKWSRLDEGWQNTFSALFEDWRSDLEIEELTLLAQYNFEAYKSRQSKTLSDDIGEELSEIRKFIDDTRQQIEKEPESIGKILKKQNYYAQKQLDKVVIPKLVEKLSNKSLINSINRLEVHISEAQEALTTERKTPKVAVDYTEPLDSEDITTISPYELIAFEIAPSLNKLLGEVKSSLLQALNEQIVVAQDLDHMITFGLSSGVDHLAKNEKDHEGTRVIVLESLERTERRVDDIQQALNDSFDATNEKLDKAISQYAQDLMDLTENENVRGIRVRIMRAKAVQQTEAYRDQLITSVKEFFTRLLSNVKSALNKLNDLRKKVSQRFILTSKPPAVSKEVSDFLAESQYAIEALPMIYRNLYQIEPMNDLELFVGRNMETEEVKKAYQNWEKGRMGSAVIIGEKWSGLTSFVNYLVFKSIFNQPVNRLSLVSDDNYEDQLWQFFNRVLDDADEVKDWQMIAQKLNGGVRKIIVIEDIQRLYQRKIGGFQTLQNLFQLISATSKNIFWIATSTTYSWAYFQQTIHVDEVFSYHIKLRKPSEEEVSEIVHKRTRISGYNIRFEPDESDLESKKFQKLSDAEQQAQLRSRFFKNLIDFSESNISMALMFWLLSTKEVNQNQIIVRMFKKPSLGFLQAFGMNKILGLHLLIIHDGLSVPQFADLARCSTQSAFMQLSLLQEDGILLLKKDKYLVNPLVYRSVVSLLKAKNLIH